MKLKTGLKYLLLIAFSAMVVSCSKNVDLPIDECIGGAGGEVTLILQPEHHGEPIPGQPGYPDSAFIKYNASEFPGDNPALYDRVVVGTEGESQVIVNNLTCGNYFIYMTGKDTSIDERVKGGIPVYIEETSGIKTIKIPVTED